MKVHRSLRSSITAIVLVLLLQSPLAAQGGAGASESSLKGTWSGTFYSSHKDVAPFTITAVITPNSNGHLIGHSSLNSECLKGAKLQVSTMGSTIVLAGSDEEGDSLTIRGTLSSSGEMLTCTYILNGSASGTCETDNGTGDLMKR